jgi:tetratricopeptide (TPR) repeat protein
VQEAQTVEAAKPDEAGARAGLIEAHHHLGRAQEAQNQRLPEAEKQFRAMHELAARWVQSEPESVAARDLLASSYSRLGRVLRRRNDASAAGTSYRRAIELAQEVLGRQPKNLEYKFHLALAVIDSAIFALDRQKYSDARPLLEQSERLFEELVAADPEDRENQVWLVHTLYQYGRLERDEDHYAKAEDDFRRALESLRRLDGAGKLEGRPAFKYRHVQSLEREIAYCSAAPRILENPTTARSTVPYVTIKLLLLRARRLAERSRIAEMTDTARKLCAFEDGDGSDQFTLARALATCVRYLENDPLQGLSDRERSDLKRRCTDRAVAALSRALDKGFTDLFDLNATVDMDPIRGDPGFQELVLRLKEREAPASRGAGAP